MKIALFPFSSANTADSVNHTAKRHKASMSGTAYTATAYYSSRRFHIQQTAHEVLQYQPYHSTEYIDVYGLYPVY